jgi:hypothetical protein
MLGRFLKGSKMKKISEWYDNKQKKGALLKEIDAFLELEKNHENVLQDNLTGKFGRAHGDYNLANKQAEACIQFANAMMRGDTSLPELLKTAKKSKSSKVESSDEAVIDGLPDPV